MARLSKRALIERTFEAITTDGWTIVPLTQGGAHPARFTMMRDNASRTIRLYIWNISPGGNNRPESEYRIQLTGIEQFEAEPDGQTLIIGWSEQFGMFAGFDIQHRLGKLGTSPSIQINQMTLEAGHSAGVAKQDKTNGEWALAIRPDKFASYVQHLASAHSGDLTDILSSESRSIPIPQFAESQRPSNETTALGIGPDEERVLKPHFREVITGPVADAAISQLITAVTAHYDEGNTQPLLLSTFGQKNKTLLAELKDLFGSLKTAVRVAGEGRIQFVDTTSGREAVAPAAIAPNLRQHLQEDKASQRQAASCFDSLPTSVQLAFCIRTEADEHVALETVRPFRFAKVKVPDLIRSTQRIIPDKYRRPGLSLRVSSVSEREGLWKHFIAWAEEAGIDPGIFHQGGVTTALSRLIAAQPSDLIARLVIPGDIAQLLLKHS